MKQMPIGDEITVSIESLDDYPRNAEIYGDPMASLDDEFIESIRQHGWIQRPLVVRQGEGRFMIVSGHRRVAAARKLGWQEACVGVFSPESDAEVRMVWLDSNRHRNKSFQVILKEALQIIDIQDGIY